MLHNKGGVVLQVSQCLSCGSALLRVPVKDDAVGAKHRAHGAPYCHVLFWAQGTDPAPSLCTVIAE